MISIKLMFKRACITTASIVFKIVSKYMSHHLSFWLKPTRIGIRSKSLHNCVHYIQCCMFVYKIPNRAVNDMSAIDQSRVKDLKFRLMSGLILSTFTCLRCINILFVCTLIQQKTCLHITFQYLLILTAINLRFTNHKFTNHIAGLTEKFFLCFGFAQNIFYFIIFEFWFQKIPWSRENLT